tara:strand:+ start:685 stop:1461 length:777 start_codon:yes stop_codon:yes gene_type:complete
MKKNNKYFTANIKTDHISYGFFSKINGFSKNNFYSLNCSFNSGDKKNLVEKNRINAIKQLGFENKKIKFINQIHSSKVHMINKKNYFNLIKGDGLITKEKEIVLAILTADCAPIFISDNKNSFICSLHSGWKGCLKNIIKNATNKIKLISPNKSNLFAIVGPCLAKKNFEVDKKFQENFVNINNNYNNFFFQKPKSKKYLFDMRGLINFQLKSCSIKKVFNINMDTYFNNSLFFSHRYSKHNNILPTGRMINLIGFKE